MKDKLSTCEIKKLIGNIDILIFDELESTNKYIKTLAEEKEEFFTVIAESQTSGRGRLGRTFFSPKGNGIYMSILLKPSLKAENSVLITAAAACAVSRAIETVGKKQTKIKWVNDIYINNKKVCGILTEGSINQDGSLNYAILGIGINAYTPKGGFNKEIKDIAGAVFDREEENQRNMLISQVISNFKEYYISLEEKSFLTYYKEKNLVLGEKITAPKGKAKAIDIDENCRLLVEYKNGKKEYLSSGEISIGVDFFEQPNSK